MGMGRKSQIVRGNLGLFEGISWRSAAKILMETQKGRKGNQWNGGKGTGERIYWLTNPRKFSFLM